MQPEGYPREVIELDSDSDDGLFDLLVPEPRTAATKETSPNRVAAARPPDSFRGCLTQILELFPDISQDYVQQLYDMRQENPLGPNDDLGHELIMQILDAEKYPKERDRLNDLKRKWVSGDSDAEETAKWTDPNRGVQSFEYLQEASYVLLGEFVDIPKRFIDLKLKENGNFYAAYQALEAANNTYDDTAAKPFQRLKKSRGKNNTQNLESEEPVEGGNAYVVAELKHEIHAARKKRRREEAQRQLQQDLAAAEAAVDQEYRDNGDVMDCECCYNSIPLHRTTHCDGIESHFFCMECARRNADHEIGKGSYIIECLAGCKALFSREQKERFLTLNILEKLDRIQQHKEIEGAEVIGLAHCPFCDYAAEVPPVEVDKEFRCNAPSCSKISCRLCNRDTHIPLTCEQAKKENGISERHVLEEAMSLALMKACPRCAKQIVKDDGCNKVKCPCGCIICDCCGKDITSQGYNHFDGSNNPVGGGRSNLGQKKCPVYDDTLLRREADIKKAEQETLQVLKKDNPTLNEDDLKIKFSEATRSPPRPHVHHGIANGHGIPARYADAILRGQELDEMAIVLNNGINQAQQRLRDREVMMRQNHARLAAMNRLNAERLRGQAAGQNAGVNAPQQQWLDPLMPMRYPPYAAMFRPVLNPEAVAGAEAGGVADLAHLQPGYFLPLGPIPRHMNPMGYGLRHYPPGLNPNQMVPPRDPLLGPILGGNVFGGNLDFGANPFRQA